MAETCGVKRMKLGSQGLEVSAQGLGCMGLSSFYGAPQPETDAIALLHHAINSGVTFLDTSDIYGPQTNELLLGKVRFFSSRDGSLRDCSLLPSDCLEMMFIVRTLSGSEEWVEGKNRACNQVRDQLCRGKREIKEILCMLELLVKLVWSVLMLVALIFTISIGLILVSLSKSL